MNNIIPNLTDKKVVFHLIKNFKIRLSKKLGQNFLINDNVARDIVASANITKDDTILEIGTGIGALTQKLAETEAEIITVELDRSLLSILEKTLEPYKNVRIIHGDILKLDLNQEIPNKRYKVVANLPYYITTPIILSLLEKKLPMELFVVMIQKEVAERIVAEPNSKTYGALSIAIQYYTVPEIMFTVSNKSFIPEPGVESAVLRCTLRDTPPVDVKDEQLFFKTVRSSFAQRRKTLFNNLKAAGIDKDQIPQILSKADIDGTRRAEQLSIEEFARISNAWFDLLK
ncbi:16S rRNA (adenine(1518)-N(6)/adenine(1519)-N(6))-dimethyltransferase RsmA [Selenomonadales bacterium OttesenSCG-928-I06]|nr:16S rRNA (adenine(1518)-N(6)/adenine(1519)-N(6))-dimethyltransferase RsmA [Selenomonadales bacterium OttesenSCG-928-I06]